MYKPRPLSSRIFADLKRSLHSDLHPLKGVRNRYLVKMENVYLTELMRQTDGNIDLACRISSLSRSRLYALLKKHSLSSHQ